MARFTRDHRLWNIISGFADNLATALLWLQRRAVLPPLSGGPGRMLHRRLMPAGLLPLIGAEPVVAIIAIAANLHQPHPPVRRLYFVMPNRRRTLIVIFGGPR